MASCDSSLARLPLDLNLVALADYMACIRYEIETEGESELNTNRFLLFTTILKSIASAMAMPFFRKTDKAIFKNRTRS